MILHQTFYALPRDGADPMSFTVPNTVPSIEQINIWMDEWIMGRERGMEEVAFIYTFIRQILIEHLLCAQNSSRFLGLLW